MLPTYRSTAQLRMGLENHKPSKKGRSDMAARAVSVPLAETQVRSEILTEGADAWMFCNNEMLCVTQRY